MIAPEYLTVIAIRMDYKIIVNNESKLEITIDRKASFNTILFTGFFTIVFIGLILKMSYELVKAPYKLDEKLAITIIICILAELFACKLFLWNLRGKEKVVIKENEFIIRKIGSFLSVPRKYELSLIDNFACTKNSPYPGWMTIFGIAGGQIEFYYLAEPRYFGQTLSQVQAQEIIELIQAKMYTGIVQP